MCCWAGPGCPSRRPHSPSSGSFAILTRTHFPAGQTDADASGNWWGSPTGPTIASNPGGMGNPLDDHVAFTPFLTALPTCASDPVPGVPAVSGAGLVILALLLAGVALLQLR